MKEKIVSGMFAALSVFCLSGCQPSKSASYEEKKHKTCMVASELNGIIGGVKVNSNDFLAKKVVMLMAKKGDSASICTGTPISKDVILTAAHCVNGIEKKDIAVVFHTDVTCESGFNSDKQVVVIQDYIAHSGFSGKSDATNDLALVKLPAPIPSDYEITEIFDGKSKLSADQVTLTGYGVTDESGDGAMFLRTTVKSFKEDMVVAERKITIEQKSNGVCSGDSGGPVLVKVDGKLKIAGVNSTVRGSTKETICHDRSVAVYVPYYLDWIQTQSANLN